VWLASAALLDLLAQQYPKSVCERHAHQTGNEASDYRLRNRLRQVGLI